jgi:hypothetical protein
MSQLAKQTGAIAAWSSALPLQGFIAVLVAAACFISAPPLAWAEASSGQLSASVSTQQEMPIHLRRGLPRPGHALLAPLEGTWRVEKSFFAVIGTPDNPVVSRDIISRRTWVAGGRYLRDETEGTIAGAPYWRLGLLGYSTMDERYEWVTIDATNANMMIYLGVPGAGARMPITMVGTFTDQGWLGEKNAGRPVGMRTVIRIENNERHIFELYFTPPDGSELLFDRSVYTRAAS